MQVLCVSPGHFQDAALLVGLSNVKCKGVDGSAIGSSILCM